MTKCLIGLILRSVILFLAISSSTFAIVPNQPDNFEDGTTQGWDTGIPDPTPPINITSGGPAGIDDNYLQLTSSGGAGAGSKLVVINSAQWTGDFLSAGVQYVNMYIKNLGNTTLNLRIALRGPGGDFWSVNPVLIAPLTDWQMIEFSIQPSDMTGGTNLISTLSGITAVRILSSLSGGIVGDAIIAQIGLDNITATAQAIPVELTNFSASTSKSKVILEWSTATETNNHRFEVQRKFDENSWQTVGTVSGSGTTAKTKNYSFIDDISEIAVSTIQYRLKQIDFNGSFNYSGEVSVVNNKVTSFELSQNYPNPFNPTTRIRFSVPSISKNSFASGEQTVVLKIYDIIGNEIATLVNEIKSVGTYEIDYNAGNLSNGVYLYTLKAGNYSATKKLIIMK